jgi:hypothetical protein
MKRGLGILFAATVLCTLVAIPLGATSASALVLGTGTPTCTGIVGKLSFQPPLKAGGLATHEEIHIKGKVFGCAGGAPVPTTGKIAGKGIIHGAGANNCSAYFPTGTMTFTGSGFFVEVEWAGIVTTRVDFPTLTITNPGGGAGPEIFTGGPTPVTGSYLPSETLSLATVSTQSVITGTTAGNCSGAGGLKKAVFGAAGTTGTF